MKPSAIAVGLVVLLGCGTIAPWSQTPQPVPEVPDQFFPDSSFTITPDLDPSCLVHLIDVETDTRILLIRSTYPARVSDSTVNSALGDYKVPDGRFGIGSDHLLRILCATGRPLGKVHR